LSAFYRRRGPPPAPKHRVNERIRTPQVRVIDDEDNQCGVMTTLDAKRLAAEKGLDLVEISPTAVPPVCRIMDYGKFKYEDKKKKAESRKKQHQASVKELRVRPNTGEHDIEVKLKKAREFLEAGDKVSITVRFRGREIVHAALGQDILKRIADELIELGKVERPPRMEGRRLNMVLCPIKK